MIKKYHTSRLGQQPIPVNELDTPLRVPEYNSLSLSTVAVTDSNEAILPVSVPLQKSPSFDIPTTVNSNEATLPTSVPLQEPSSFSTAITANGNGTFSSTQVPSIQPIIIAQSQWVQVIPLLLPVLVPFLILLVTGKQGLDFGNHWDEGYHLAGMIGSVQKGIPFPDGHYDYPSVAYWLHVVGAIPELIQAIQLKLTHAPDIRQHIIAFLNTPDYTFRMRGIFLFVSSLTVVWVYILVLGWRRSWLEALAASAIIGFSWEFAYHIRWVAPDGIAVQFGTLTMLCVIFTAVYSRKMFWLRCSAIAAGLVCGTKYPLGLFILPVLVAAYQNFEKIQFKRSVLWLMGELILIFSVTYLITTPGTLFQAKDFIQGVYVNDLLYYQDSLAGHTVPAGPEHLGRIILYFMMTLLSPYAPIALLFFIFAIVGLRALYYESRQITLLFMIFPLTYTLYFSMQRVMIVRNYLVLAPFLAILAARGLAIICSRLRVKSLQIAVTMPVLLFLCLNGYWLFYSAQTIVDRKTDRFNREAATYIDQNQHLLFYVSPRVQDMLVKLDGKQRTNITSDSTQSVHSMLFYASEGLDRSIVPANDPNLTTTWFGPWEVNYNYYPTWAGDDRILVMPRTKAREVGMLLLR